MQRELIAKIATTIATQQPVAGDLRFLLALDHVAYELERMGDHAGSVAKQARKLAPQPPLAQYVHLPKMGHRAAEQVHGILACRGRHRRCGGPGGGRPATTRSMRSTTERSTGCSS